ncbi:MAG TPA: acyl-CoA dehydrogenase family protein [Actinomycetota bacterium]
MDLSLSPEERAFRDEVRAWLAENLTGEFAGVESAMAYDLDERVRLARAWEARLREGGYAGISWPKEFGGRGASLMEQVVFHEEMARARAPQISVNFVGINLSGPTIRIYGTDAQRARYLPKIISMEEIWCQGFSEPNAGSDLANVQTRAVSDGDHYVLNGQKVWTSYAHIADWMLCLVRTDPDVPKHKGLSYVIVDMKTPGVEPRPMRQITGDAEFNEVFLTDVRVPAENLVGEAGQGWVYANTTLAHERGPAFLAHQIRFRNQLDDLIEHAKTSTRDGVPLSKHPDFRGRLAAAYAEIEVMRAIGYRMVTGILRTGRPGLEASMAKLYWSEMVRRTQLLALQMEGARGMLYGADAHAGGRAQDGYLSSFAQTIAAGSTEIQKNIIAERILGLPRGEVWAPAG